MLTGDADGVINSGGDVSESSGKLRLHTQLTSMQNKVLQDEIVNALVLLVSVGSSGYLRFHNQPASVKQKDVE